MRAFEKQTSPSRIHEVGALSFFETYGLCGVPIVLIALMCIGWTSFQMALTATPNAMVNYIMKTAEFDNGTFWLIIEPDMTLVVFSLVTLGIVTLGYIGVLVRMTLLRGHRFSNPKLDNRIRMIEVARLSTMEKIQRKSALLSLQNMKRSQTHFQKYWVRVELVIVAKDQLTKCVLIQQSFWLKLADLTVETLTLYQLMERGYPLVLICLPGRCQRLRLRYRRADSAPPFYFWRSIH